MAAQKANIQHHEGSTTRRPYGLTEDDHVRVGGSMGNDVQREGRSCDSRRWPQAVGSTLEAQP